MADEEEDDGDELIELIEHSSNPLLKWMLGVLSTVSIALIFGVATTYIQFHDLARDFETYRKQREELDALKTIVAGKLDAAESVRDYYRLNSRLENLKAETLWRDNEIKDIYNDNRKPGSTVISFRQLLPLPEAKAHPVKEGP